MPKQDWLAAAQVSPMGHGHTWMQDHFDTKKIKVLMDTIVLTIPSIQTNHFVSQKCDLCTSVLNIVVVIPQENLTTSRSARYRSYTDQSAEQLIDANMSSQLG